MAATGRVAGKVALVTGGGAGLGRADCLALAREGARVVVTDIDADAARAVAAECGHGAIALGQDVSSEARWAEVIAEVEARCGGLHVLVNNAGIVVVKSPEDTTLEEFRRVNAVMSEGVFLGCRAALALMARSGGGSIINMSSVASHLGYSVFFAYAAAKGAVRSMTKALAIHCHEQGYGIRVNSVHPGAIETPMVQSAQGRIGQPQEVPKGPLPLGAVGAPEDVAALIVYLASDESRLVNGAEIVIDNGLSIAPS